MYVVSWRSALRGFGMYCVSMYSTGRTAMFTIAQSPFNAERIQYPRE